MNNVTLQDIANFYGCKVVCSMEFPYGLAGSALAASETVETTTTTSPNFIWYACIDCEPVFAERYYAEQAGETAEQIAATSNANGYNGITYVDSEGTTHFLDLRRGYLAAEKHIIPLTALFSSDTVDYTVYEPVSA